MDNTVPPVPPSMNDENLDEEEEESGGGGERKEAGMRERGEGQLSYCLTHSR